jgi:hypothetical protein
MSMAASLMRAKQISRMVAIACGALATVPHEALPWCIFDLSHPFRL